jgi:hypothetical protein
MPELFYALPPALMFLLALTPGISFTEDLGRHLLLGKTIVTEWHVPDTNLLTYTYPDFPFINHHWLSEVIFYLLHQAVGLNGLILFKALILCLALALALRSVPLNGAAPLVIFTATLAAVALGFRAHIRPEIFTCLGVAIYGWIIARAGQAPGGRISGWHWALLIAYGWFWANTHIYFIFGIGMLGAYWLASWRRNWAGGASFWRACPRAETSGLLALLGVSLLNPNGWRGLLYPLGIFGNYGLAITENAAPLTYWKSVLNPMLLVLPVLSLLAVLVLWRARRQFRRLSAGQLAGVLILLAALVAAWQMARSVSLLALTLLPAVAWAARPAPAAADAASSQRSTANPGLGIVASWLRPARIVAVIALNLALALAIVDGAYSRIFPSPIGPTPFGLDAEARYLGLRRLKADGLPGPVFSDYNSGSLVEYNLYPERGYTDNRPEAFPAEFWQKEYLPALALGPAWEELIARRGIQTVAVSTAGVKEGFIRGLLANPRWQLVHLDFFYAVFTRVTPANREFLSRHVFGPQEIRDYSLKTWQHIRALASQYPWRRQVLADQIVYEIYGLICLGRNDLAWPLAWEMYLRYPDYQLIHELLRVSAPPHAWPTVMGIMAGRARWPLAAKQVLDYGRALEAQGRAAEARAVYLRGHFFFPLSPDLPPPPAPPNH